MNRLALMLLLSSSGTALANDGDFKLIDIRLDGAEMAGFAVATITPVLFGAIDILARPGGRVYGGVELAFGAGGLAAATHRFVVEASDPTTASGEDLAVVGVLGVLNAGIIAHGIYTLVRQREPASLRVTPTVVNDGKAFVAGVGVGGAF